MSTIFISSLLGLINNGKTVTPIPINMPPEGTTMTVATSSDYIWIKSRINHYASLYEVSEITMDHIVNCESGYNKFAEGDNGMSHGLVQINKPSHPDITLDQAQDIEFSLDFLAKNLKDNKGYLWTCWKTR